MKIAVFLILLCLGIIGIVMHLNLLVYLRTHHPETWEALGRPSFLNNSIQNGLRTQAFLFKREYTGLNDPKLTKEGDRLVLISYVYVLLFICLVAVVMIKMRS